MLPELKKPKTVSLQSKVRAQLSKSKLIDMLDILSSLVRLYFEVFLLEFIYIKSFYILSLYAASHNPSKCGGCNTDELQSQTSNVNF